MFKNPHNKYFTYPKFLATPFFGVSITDDAIKFIELFKDGKEVKIGKYGERKIPEGAIESGSIVNYKVIEEILSSLKKEERLNHARISLPEEHISVFKINLDNSEIKNSKKIVEEFLKNNTQLPITDLMFEYKILENINGKKDAHITVIPKDVMEDYITIFKNAGIEVHSFEPEAKALNRSLVSKDNKDTCMIIDFNKKRTGVFVISNENVMLNSTLAIGGETLTKIIQNDLQVSFAEAEKIKNEIGLGKNKTNQDIYPILLQGVSVIADEITKQFLYWHTRKDSNGENRPQIKKIILSGSDSNLIGFLEYLSVNLKNKVEIANVWINIINTEKHIPEINFERSLSFATALGLALANFEKN